MYYNIHCHNPNTSSDVSCVINLDLSNSFQLKENELYSIGIHPWHINPNINQLDIIKKNLLSDKVIALGEIGLDIIKKNLLSDKVIALGEIGLDKKCTTPFPDQIIYFEKQIKIAESVRKPIIIHCVKAYQEIIQHQKNSSVPWLIHSFNGTVELADQLIRAYLKSIIVKTIFLDLFYNFANFDGMVFLNYPSNLKFSKPMII